MEIEDQRITRRHVSVRAIYGLTSIVGAFLSAPAVMYLFSAPGSSKKTGWIDAGETERTPPWNSGPSPHPAHLAGRLENSQRARDGMGSCRSRSIHHCLLLSLYALGVRLPLAGR